MKRIISIFLAISMTISILSGIKIHAVAIPIVAGSGAAAFGGAAAAAGGAFAADSIGRGRTDRLNDLEVIGTGVGADVTALRRAREEEENILDGSILSQTEINSAVQQAANIMEKWYNANYSKIYTFDEAMALCIASDYPFTNETEAEAARIIAEAYNEARASTGKSVEVVDSYPFDEYGYTRTTTSVDYLLWKRMNNNIFAKILNQPADNLFARIKDGVIQRAIQIVEAGKCSYFDTNGIFYKSCDIFKPFSLVSSPDEINNTQKSFVTFSYSSGAFNSNYWIYPYIVVDGKMYISKNAALKYNYSGTGSSLGYSPYVSGLTEGSIYYYNTSAPNLFKFYNGYSGISKELVSSKIYMTFDTSGMGIHIFDYRYTEFEPGKTITNKVFTANSDFIYSTAVSASDISCTGSDVFNGGTRNVIHDITGVIAVPAGNDYFYNLTDKTDTIPYTEVAGIKGSITDSGYLMKTATDMTADESEQTDPLSALLNLPISIIEAAAIAAAAEKGMTDEQLDPPVYIINDITPEGVIIDTSVSIPADDRDLVGDTDEDDDKPLVYVPDLPITGVGEGELPGGQGGLFGGIGNPRFNLYEQCKKLISNVWNYNSTASPPNFKFYYDSNGDGVSEEYNVLDLSFLETQLTNENLADKSWFSNPIRIIDLIRWLTALVIYSLFVMRLIKRLPGFYGQGGMG